MSMFFEELAASRGIPHSPIVSGASLSMTDAGKMGGVFNQIDVARVGAITDKQFGKAFTKLKKPAAYNKMGAEAIFKLLAPGGNNTISMQDFIQGMLPLMAAVRNRQQTNASEAVTPAQTLNSSLQSLIGLLDQPGPGAGGSLNTSV